jgi:hypothetical protein
MFKNYTNYSKFIVALLGAAGTALETQFPGNHWSAGVISGITAVLVWLVPNTPKPTATGTMGTPPPTS